MLAAGIMTIYVMDLSHEPQLAGRSAGTKPGVQHHLHSRAPQRGTEMAPIGRAHSIQWLCAAKRTL